MNNSMQEKPRTPSIAISLLPVVTLVIFHCKIKWEDIEGQIARNIYGIVLSLIYYGL